MRSPPVRIGGFDWNIKYYPKGNGTDQISVYIECSKPKPSTPDVGRAKENSSQDAYVADPAPASAGAASSESMEVENAATSNGRSVPVPAPETATANDASNTSNSPTPTETTEDENADKSWSVAAQFGVVLYNPNEPRVQYNHGNQHRFDPHAPDWGWTRFHGPHSDIHIRQRGQRQALLRNDTLAFTAHVRVVHDETGGLWAYPSNPWDSLERTGLRGLGSEGPGRAYIVAGISAWALLAPFREIMYKTHLPDPTKEPRAKPKPLVTAMQRLLYRLSAQRDPSTSPVSLNTLTSAFQWYGLELTTKLDVIEFWEILRRKLDQELSGTEMEGMLGDLFDGLVERQVKDGEGGMVTDTVSQPLSIGKAPSFRLPITGAKSVQEALAKALNGDEKIGKASLSKLPKVMQVELQRQKFDTTTRRWTKMVDEVKIDETLDLKPWVSQQETESSYTLYGFIVHNEGLESSLYYPVIRPGGPGTKWFTYLDEKEESKVICLTRKQAIELHQGVPSGKKAEGTEPVAYILMYVRNDVAGDFLKGIPEIGEPASWIRKWNLPFSPPSVPNYIRIGKFLTFLFL
jgi:Ubiquitin carboxyl-terminal hydrolase/MATH domain